MSCSKVAKVAKVAKVTRVAGVTKCPGFSPSKNTNAPVDWDQLVNQLGTDGLANFCTGKMTRREVESFGGVSRATVRSLGTNKMRVLGKKALKRRNIPV